MKTKKMIFRTHPQYMIYLIDPDKCPNGHHLVYLNALCSINDTIPLQMNLKELPLNCNKLFLLLYRAYSFFKQLESVPKNSSAHFLYADLYYSFPYFFRFNRKVILTLHSCPKGRLKQALIKNFCSKADKVIVHSEYICSQLKNMGLSNIVIVDYPSFYDYSSIPSKEELISALKIPHNKLVISALGGTRYDKGIDILIESFKYIPESVREQLLLNIAGDAVYMDEDTIRSLCMKYKIHHRLNIRPLSDKEFMQNVKISDYIVLPYRKKMTGNSGPMTEAIINEIPVIVPDHGNIGDIALKKEVGIIFRSEDPKDLAETIRNELKNKSVFNFSYKEQLSVEAFIEKHRLLYNNIKTD